MASPDLTGQAPADHAQVPTDTPPHAAPTHLVLSATALGVLARDVAARLPLNAPGQALAAALDDAAELADAWVEAQLDALAQPHVAPRVAPLAPQPATPTATPATTPQQSTATAAVLAATSQLGDGATARNISEHLAAQHQLDVSPGSVRAILSRARREQQEQIVAPPQHGTGMYL